MKYLILSLIIVGCASKPPKDPGPNARAGVESQSVSMEGKLLASEEETRFVTEITFPKKGQAVSKNAKQQLKNLYLKAHKKGPIENVKVITWADSEYPSVHQKQLSEKQIKLVQNRNDNLEKSLKALDDKLKVEKISMAERPDYWDKLTGNEDYAVKKSLETAGLPNTDTTVKIPAKASKSIIIFVPKKE